MGLINELYALQERDGYCSDAGLRELSERLVVPLYRLEGLVSFYPHFRRTPPPRAAVHLCRDLSCVLADRRFCARARERLSQIGGVEVHEVSCLGRCDQAPAATINEVPVVGGDLEVLATLAADPDRLPADEPTTTPRRWRVDPYAAASEHYGVLRAHLAEGDAAFTRAIATLEASGHRGMGGAGFPTGMKWKLVAKEKGTPKYVVVNADESEPGTFKDRVILEELPHLVIEGALLGARAIGAQHVTIYLRHEYTREKKALARALDRARRDGVLGASVLGSGWRCDVDIFTSPGGYILGEETALLEALEDKRGEPRNKPPFPGTHGLWGRPTLINNVETLALVPTILRRGAEAWKALGKNGGTGLKLIALSGDVVRPGVYEIPMGETVAALIEQAGGMAPGRTLKGFMPGGASSNFLPASAVNVPLDFAALQKAGSMLGSGAVVVIAEGNDMIELATNVVRFFRNESCGKCVPCRVGSEKSVDILERVLAGRATQADFDLLAPLAETMRETSICGLGQVVLNPLLSAAAHFPGDLAPHLRS